MNGDAIERIAVALGVTAKEAAITAERLAEAMEGPPEKLYAVSGKEARRERRANERANRREYAKAQRRGLDGYVA